MRFKAYDFWENGLHKLSFCGSQVSLLSIFNPRQTVLLTTLIAFVPIVIGLIGPMKGLFVSIIASLLSEWIVSLCFSHHEYTSFIAKFILSITHSMLVSVQKKVVSSANRCSPTDTALDKSLT